MTDPRTDFEFSYQTYTEAILPRLEAADGNVLTDTFAPIVASLRTLDAERAAVQASPHLTHEGKQAQLQALVTAKGAAAQQQLAAAEKRAQTVADEIARIENNAAPPLVIEVDGKRYHDVARSEKRKAEHALREREIRDRLYAMDDGARQDLYKSAVTSGDQELLRAFELAPAAFPLVPSWLMQEVRKARIATSPAAPRLKQLATLNEGFGLLLDAARRSLGGR